MGSYYGWHGWGMGFSWIIVVGIVIAIFYLLRGDKHQNLSAREILDKRYARGEIDTQEYLERLNTLEQSQREKNQKKGG